MACHNLIRLVILHVVNQYLVGIALVTGVVDVHHGAIESNLRGIG